MGTYRTVRRNPILSSRDVPSHHGYLSGNVPVLRTHAAASLQQATYIQHIHFTLRTQNQAHSQPYGPESRQSSALRIHRLWIWGCSWCICAVLFRRGPQGPKRYPIESSSSGRILGARDSARGQSFLREEKEYGDGRGAATWS